MTTDNAAVREAKLREEFTAYCREQKLIIAPMAGGWCYAFEAWKAEHMGARDDQ